MNSPYPREDVPGLDGPDYVTLVIEWDDSDAATIVSTRQPARELGRASGAGRKIATVAGALAAVALATWGLRHLRAS